MTTKDIEYCNELTGPDVELKVNPYTGFPDHDQEVDEEIDTSNFHYEGGKNDEKDKV